MSSRTSSKAAMKRHREKLSDGFELSENIDSLQDKRRKCSEDGRETKCRANGVHEGLVDGVPKCLMDFYVHAQNICRSDPCAAFEELASARLVGLFDFLCGDFSDLSEEERLLHCRHATDLPEMQTVLLCQIGRYCLWRDIPNGEECFILYVPNDSRFPKIEVVGNRMEHAIVHLGEKVKKPVEKFLPTAINGFRKQMKTVCAERNKRKLGEAPNGAGLWVQVVDDVGYRPISENPMKIKKMLEQICNADEDSNRQSAMKWLMEIIAYVQMANDECDFGMGLELGYWLFLANHESLDKLAYRILSTAYTLLKRDEYKKILDLQMSSGVRRRKELGAKR